MRLASSRWTLLVCVLGLAGTASAAAPPATTEAEHPITKSIAECRLCHAPAVAGMQPTAHFGLPRSCATCHGDTDEHLKSNLEKGVPGPVQSMKKLKAQEVNATCLSCHDKGRQANWHGGLHERRGVSCISCHSVHSFRSGRAQLKTTFEADTCYTCHTNIRNKQMRVSHHPIREGLMGCASCHDPHDGTRPRMVKGESLNETCYACHTEKRGPHLWEHAPVRDNCASCHDPHGSNHEKLLVAKQPYLCQRCHLNTRHPGTLYDFRNTLAGTSPSNRAVEHSCRNCHQNVHGGNAPSGPYLGR